MEQPNYCHNIRDDVYDANDRDVDVVPMLVMWHQPIINLRTIFS
jgi:hypothetical protein